MRRPRGLLGLAGEMILGLCQARKCAVWTNEVVGVLPVGAVAALDAAVEVRRARRQRVELELVALAFGLELFQLWAAHVQL